MADRSWVVTDELEALAAKGEAFGASDWTLSAEKRIRTFLEVKERLQGRFHDFIHISDLSICSAISWSIFIPPNVFPVNNLLYLFHVILLLLPFNFSHRDWTGG